MTEPPKAVFLSYASQDVEAANQICEALGAAGIAVWFDQSELRGGDAWDRQIKKQIHDCAIFIPLISATTQGRLEGYFRREWRLAVDRTRDMSERVAFLMPVLIDDTDDSEADVPEAFRAVQWTRLPAGKTSPAFVDRIVHLLSPCQPVSAQGRRSAGPALTSHQPTPGSVASRRSGAILLLLAATVMAGGYFAINKLVLSKRGAFSTQTAVSASRSSAPAQSNIPRKSIAVLPFVNMSSDKEQEYFSDGLTEEMINVLGQVPDLRVPARTSSFYFKGKAEAIATIARELQVANVLEGSVRKSGHRLRITAQLIRADNGYHLWSQTYDRDDTDIFAVQDDIAKAVVGALRVKLAGGAPGTGSRGTTNTEAYNQYLLGRQLYRGGGLESDRHAVDAYGQAIALDDNYAAAYAELAVAEASVADDTGDRRGIERAGRDVDKAIALAPNDAIGYAARSEIRTNWLWDWSGAYADIEKALSLDPRNSDVQFRYARLLEALGRLPEAIAAQKQATELDPLSSIAWESLGRYYVSIGDYAPADTAIGRAIEIEPTAVYASFNRGTLRLLQGNGEKALEAFRKIDQESLHLTGIAMAEHTLGQPKESQQALEELMARHAQEAAYQVAAVYSWRGEKDKAFEWLERAYRQRDGGLASIKIDRLLASLHGDPRFKTLLHEMNLPE